MEKMIWDTFPLNYHYEETFDAELVVSFIMENAGSLFEASVGTGIIATMLRKRGWIGKYLGSDYNDTFLSHAKAHNPEEEFMKVDLSKPIPLADDSYDICLVHHGLEYVYPYAPAIKELARIAKEYVILVFWVDFFDRPNEIRFNEVGKWNVNFYNRKEFYDAVSDAGLHVRLDAENREPGGKYNRILILCHKK